MWNQKVLQRERTTTATVAVAVDENKSSQNALKWAANNLLSEGQTVALIHVNPTNSSAKDGIDDWPNEQEPNYDQHNDFFLPFRIFCSSRNVLWELITLHDSDIAKALIEYIVLNRIETLVLGAPSKKKNISRLFTKTHVGSTVSKGAPDFCAVYVISKGKVTSMKSAIRPLNSIVTAEMIPPAPQNSNGSTHYVSTLPRCRTTDNRVHDEYSVSGSSGSFASSGRVSSDSMLFTFYDNLGTQERARRSVSVRKNEIGTFFLESKLTQFGSMDGDLSSSEEEPKNRSSSPQSIEHMEEKMRSLELQMKQTMDMYHAACKEALREKQKAKELQSSRKEEENRLKEERRAKEEALEIVAKFKEAVEAANAARRKAEQEAKRSKTAERKALKEAEFAKMIMLESLGHYSHSAVPRNQSLLNILVVLSVFYIYTVTRKCIFM